jgi:hypothetical protein
VSGYSVDLWELLACHLSFIDLPFCYVDDWNWQIRWTLMDGPAGLAANIVEN